MNVDTGVLADQTVPALRSLTRAYGDMNRLEALRKLSRAVFGEERSPEQVQGLLAAAIDSLPPGYGRAAHAMFWPSSTALRIRQEQAAAALNYSWESFRKRYLDTLYFEFAGRLHELASAPAGAGEPAITSEDAALRVVTELTASVSNAVFLIGSLLVVKLDDQAVGATLSPEEVRDLNAQRSTLLGDPAAALAFLKRDRKSTNG